MLDKTNDIFLANLESLLKAKDWKIPQLAEATGLSVSGLYSLTSGRSFPGPDNFDRIAKAFGVTAADLLRVPGQPTLEEMRLEVVRRALVMPLDQLEDVLRDLRATEEEERALESKGEKPRAKGHD